MNLYKDVLFSIELNVPIKNKRYKNINAINKNILCLFAYSKV